MHFLLYGLIVILVGGVDTSIDAYQVREKLCSEEWIAFLTTLLASPDHYTRRHVHAALLSLEKEHNISSSTDIIASNAQDIVCSPQNHHLLRHLCTFIYLSQLV